MGSAEPHQDEDQVLAVAAEALVQVQALVPVPEVALDQELVPVQAVAQGQGLGRADLEQEEVV